MLTKRKPALYIAALTLVALAAGLTALDIRLPRSIVTVGWTPQRLRDELERAGLVYEGRILPQGYFLRRPGDGMRWDEMADYFATLPADRHSARGRLQVTCEPTAHR
jgi:hypothetical protein